jgi:hypothetical protein
MKDEWGTGTVVGRDYLSQLSLPFRPSFFFGAIRFDVFDLDLICVHLRPSAAEWPLNCF